MMHYAIQHKFFLFEAIKITLFCLFIVALFSVIGATSDTLLVTFNMAVMSCAATFSPDKKHPAALFYGSVVMIVSILSGGLLGFYLPLIAQMLVVVYAVLAFLIPTTRFNTNIFVTSAVMFLIFTALPFDWRHSLHYGLYGLLLIGLLLLFYWLFDRKVYATHLPLDSPLSQARQSTALIAGLALLAAWGSSVVLSRYTPLSHLYWIGLTVLVIIQGSQHKMIRTSLVRIAVNAVGALLVVILMTYIVPKNFWINLSLLTVFLFLIFALGYSYMGRTLFIELFVLSFTHLLGNYHNVVAFDRVILTLIGGVLVILLTLLVYGLTTVK